MSKKDFVYINDIIGYDGLIKFGNLYPTFDNFKDLLMGYMLFTSEEDIEEKVYNILYNKYKNFYFKWRYQADIHEEVAKWNEEYISIKKSLEINAENGVTDKDTQTQININNATEEENTEYPDVKVVSERINGKETAEWNSKLQERQSKLRTWIENFRFLLMDMPDETLEKENK